MKNTFKMAKVGQKVYSLQYGTGRVSRNSGGDLSVEYYNSMLPKIIIALYSYDGKQKGLHFPSKRELYFKKPVIITKKRISKIDDDGFDEGCNFIRANYFVQSNCMRNQIKNAQPCELNKKPL